MAVRTNYIPPQTFVKKFTCPHCHHTAPMYWSHQATVYYKHKNPGQPEQSLNFQIRDMNQLAFALCSSCEEFTVWEKQKLIFPLSGGAPSPNPDMPQDVLEDYEEADRIVNLSPRGAAALLRLAIQKLMPHLGEKGKNLDRNIANLVKRGLLPAVQQALDAVRVIGNEAVHPGLLDLRDDVTTVSALFNLINIICDQMITKPKEVSEIYGALPESKTQAIERRDGKTKT